MGTSIQGWAIAARLLAATLALAATSAGAQEVPPAATALREEVRTVLFGGFEAGTTAFASAGAKHALDALDRDGLILMGGAGYGARFERDGNDPARRLGLKSSLVLRHTVLAHALAGWQWTFDWGVVALLAGPELSYERLASRYAPDQPGPRFGGRVHGEVWARPTDETLFTATLIAGSARGDAWGRLSWGWRLFGAYVGPEAALYADLTDYRKASVGLHATALALFGTQLRISAGFLREYPARRDGGYVALTAWRPF